jgi:hypothetical protein
MADTLQAATSMRQRLEHECERLQAVREEMNRLAPSYHRFVDLQDEFERRRSKAQTIAAVLGQESLGKNKQWEDVYADYVTAVGTPPRIDELRRGLPLWEGMKEFLGHVSESRINEMLEFFRTFRHTTVNRAAIESAIKRHPGVFGVRKRKWEKFVYLKSRAKDG